MKTIIFDVETTGLPVKGGTLEQQPCITEFGAKYLDDDGSTIRTVNQLIFPGTKIWDNDIKRFTDKIPKYPTKLNGIAIEHLIGKPTFFEALPFINEFFHGADVLIAHNASYDVGVLKDELSRISITKGLASCVVGLAEDFPFPKTTICTKLEYTHLNGGRWPKLEVLYEMIMNKPLVQTHRALDDVNAVHEIIVEDGFLDKIANSL